MSRRETKFYLKTIAIICFLVVIFGYGAYEAWNYAAGPEIKLSSPQNGAVVSESLVSIEGWAKSVKEITLNDRPIVIDETGNFSEQILLSYGYNVLTLSAKDRFGQKTGQELQIVYR